MRHYSRRFEICLLILIQMRLIFSQTCRNNVSDLFVGEQDVRKILTSINRLPSSIMRILLAHFSIVLFIRYMTYRYRHVMKKI